MSGAVVREARSAPAPRAGRLPPGRSCPGASCLPRAQRLDRSTGDDAGLSHRQDPALLTARSTPPPNHALAPRGHPCSGARGESGTLETVDVLGRVRARHSGERGTEKAPRCRPGETRVRHERRKCAADRSSSQVAHLREESTRWGTPSRLAVAVGRSLRIRSAAADNHPMAKRSITGFLRRGRNKEKRHLSLEMRELMNSFEAQYNEPRKPHETKQTPRSDRPSQAPS
jgi:hypothetical protein